MMAPRICTAMYSAPLDRLMWPVSSVPNVTAGLRWLQIQTIDQETCVPAVSLDASNTLSVLFVRHMRQDCINQKQQGWPFRRSPAADVGGDVDHDRQHQACAMQWRIDVSDEQISRGAVQCQRSTTSVSHALVFNTI